MNVPAWFGRWPPWAGILPVWLSILTGQQAMANPVLRVDIDVRETVGDIDRTQLAAMLGAERVLVTAFYHPRKLIAGRTARREPKMPFGSVLIPILRTEEYAGANIARRPAGLSFALPSMPPDGEGYGLARIEVVIPVPVRPGRHAQLSINCDPPSTGQSETSYGWSAPPTTGVADVSAFRVSGGSFELIGEISLRWSDAPASSIR